MELFYTTSLMTVCERNTGCLLNKEKTTRSAGSYFIYNKLDQFRIIIATLQELELIVFSHNAVGYTVIIDMFFFSMPHGSFAKEIWSAPSI
jgi:hypothetical protein